MAPKKKPAVTAQKRTYKGMYKNKGLWKARMWDEDHEIYLGHFETEVEAATAFDKASIAMKGLEAAVRDGLNFPFDKYAGQSPKHLETVVQELRASGPPPSS